MKVSQYIGKAHGGSAPGNLPSIPSTGDYERALGQAAAGMNEIGKGLGAIAEVGKQIWEKNKEKRRNIDVQNMQIETEKDWLSFKTGYDRSNPDPMDYTKETEKAWDNIVKERSKMTKDGETTRLYKEKMSARKMMILINAQAEADKRFHDAYFAESISNVDEWAKLAVNTENPVDAEIFKVDMLSEIHKGYPFTQKYAGELEVSKLDWIQKERAKNTKGRVYQDILRDPGGTLQKLMLPPEAGQYPDITDPTERESLRVHAQNIFKVKQTEQLQEEARVKTENHDAEELQIGSLYSIGKLKIDDIQKAKFLGGDERYTWTARIEAKQKAGVVVKTNFGTYARIQDMIFSNQPKKEIVRQIAIASEKDLSEQDAETLLNKSTAYTGSMEDHWKKRGYDFLKSKFVTKKDMMGRLLETPEEIDRYLLGINILDLEVQRSQRQGKPLEGINIYDKAVEIWTGIKLTPSEKLEEKIKGIKDFGQERREAEERKKKGLPPIPAPITPKVLPTRNKNESLEDYLKRITSK